MRLSAQTTRGEGRNAGLLSGQGLLGKQIKSTPSILVVCVVPAASRVGPGLGVRLLALLSWFCLFYSINVGISAVAQLSVECGKKHLLYLPLTGPWALGATVHMRRVSASHAKG